MKKIKSHVIPTKSDLTNYEALAILFYNADFANIEKLDFSTITDSDCDQYKIIKNIRNEVL